MFNCPLCKFVSGIFLFGVMTMGQAQALDTRWRLQVKNLKNQVKVEATIRFAAAPAAESCMGGNWKRVIVESTTAQDETFFPLVQLLAYELADGNVTLGRTTICDNYLFLSGKSKAKKIAGTFNAVSIGKSRKLGYFSLKRIQ